MKQFYNALKSQKLGIIIGFIVTGLLITGSLVMNFQPRHYRGLAGEDISFFFIYKRPVHIWFYLLFFAFIVYGINTFLCTLDSVIRKVKGRVKKIPLYGASIVHIGFVITLVAHLIGGLYSETEPPVTVGNEWADLGGVEMMVTDLETTSYPNGMPKKVIASVRIRNNGKEFSDTLGYNNPVLLQTGIKEILLRNYGHVASGVVLRVDDRVCDVKINDTFNVNGTKIQVSDLYLPPQYHYPLVKLTSVTGDEDENAQQMFLPIGERNTREIYGAKVTFTNINSSPGVVVNVKNNPSIPLTFVTIIFFSIGMLLVILRVIGRMAS